MKYFFLALLYISSTDQSVSVTKIVPMENIENCRKIEMMAKENMSENDMIHVALDEYMLLIRAECVTMIYPEERGA